MSLGVVAFTTHLKSVRRSGKGYQARCPCHDDRNPSLSLQEKNGTVLFKCHAGCSQSDLVAFFRRVGVLQTSPASGALAESYKGQLITDRYTYADEAGKPLFHVCRTAGKEFPIHSPDGKWGRNGARLVPYNLPAVLKAGSVFVVEGEKDADKLTRMQLTGTTSPGGAGKWKASFNAHLKGRHVVIIPDNDEPGRRHAEQVAASLHPIAKSVKVLELPNLPDHGDLSDWVKGRVPSAAGEELRRLADQAATWKPVDQVDPQPDEGQPQSHWKWLDVHDIEKWEVEPLQPVVDGLFARGNFVIMAAASQTGKTLLALYLARKLLAGGELFEKFTVHPVGKLLYLCLEDPARRIKDRLLDIAHEFDGPPEPGQFIVHVAPGFSITDKEAGDQLEVMVGDFDVVILDTYQKATPGVSSFNDEQQSHILHRLSNLTRKTGITLIVLDHIRKDDNHNSRKELSLDDVKGTGGKVQNADSIILMQRTGRQIKLTATSKDFDTPVGILLDVAPQGSDGAKFTYAGELAKLGADSKAQGEDNRQIILEAMDPGEWVSCGDVEQRVDLKLATVRRHLGTLVELGLVDKVGIGKSTRYCRVDGLSG